MSLTGNRIRSVVLEQSKRAGTGHIGCCLSVADILAALYFDLLTDDRLDGPDRDRVILSKGHAALALYAALYCRGRLSRSELETYGTDGTLLGVHPEHQLRGIDFSTGSLGMGLSFAAGAALAARMDGGQRHVHVLMSDAECNEGSTWEAASFAAQHRLDGLTGYIDVNGQQALGYADEVLGQCATPARWSAFGWEAIELDGHDPAAIAAAVRRPRQGRPRILLCNTVFGCGVSFMERQIRWHYLPMTDADYAQALHEIGGPA